MANTITLCMIVKNEESVLDRCLESVRNIVDEIIIVDTGSTDSTLKIARKYTDNIYSFEWVNDFSAARNESLKYATSDYILHLDADEYLEADCNFREDLDKGLDYYLCKIKNQIALDRTFTFMAVRLFRNHISLKYENRLHEHLNINNPTIQYTVGESNQLIHHVGYTQDKMQEKDKHNRNLPLMQLEVKENPTAYNLYNMGKTYFAISEYKKAINYFKEAYPLSKDRLFLPELLTKLAYALAEVDQIDEALTILLNATMLFPDETEMRYLLGMIYLKADYYRDAEKSLLKCIELGDRGSLFTEGSGGYMAHMSLSELYEKMGELEKSYNEVLKVLKLKKNFAPGLQQYLKLVLKLSMRSEEIHERLNEYYTISSVNDLQQLLDVMYGARNPLLDHYLTTYNISVQPNVLATAKIYARKYEESRLLWESIGEKEGENGQDLLLLAIVMGDDRNLIELQHLLSLSKKEILTLMRIINGHSGKCTFTDKLEEILLEVCRHLIILREFEHFQVLVEKMVYIKSEIKLKVSGLLTEYKFDELAIDMLITLFKERPNNISIIKLLGDLCYRNNYLEDAHLFYTKLLKLSPQYSSYERGYQLYEKFKDYENALNIKQEIVRLFPMANWAKENI